MNGVEKRKPIVKDRTHGANAQCPKCKSHIPNLEEAVRHYRKHSR